MAIRITHKEAEFGVGDRVRVHQKVKDGDKSREAIFEGMVIKIKGREPGKTFTIRKIGEAGVGIERIFPLNLPSLEKIVVVRAGTSGVRRAKLYYTRKQSPTQVDMIFKRSQIRSESASIKSAAKKKNK